MAIYQLGKCIRMMREALRMTQEQMVEWYTIKEEGKYNFTKVNMDLKEGYKRYDICSAQVLRRIENDTARRIKAEVLFGLMEKIGVLPEQFYASIMADEPWALNLKAQIYTHMCQGEYEKAEKVLLKLKPMMVPGYPRNKQYLMQTEAIIAYHKKNIDVQEYLNVLFAALRQTVPMLDEIDIAEWPWNGEEFCILISIAYAYHSIKDREKELEFLLKLKKNVERKYMELSYYTVWHTWILVKLSSLMCMENKRDKSMEYCEVGIMECKEFKILGSIHYLLYDSVWCKEQRLREGFLPEDRSVLEEQESQIKKERVFCKKRLVHAYYLSKVQGDFYNTERIKRLWEKYYPNETKLI